jgi:HlyD family secretion protein
VVARQVDVGQTVAASYQTPELFKIAQDLTKLQIHSNFAEADIGQIRVGQKAQFSVDAYPTRKFDAVVEQIRLNPTVQQNVVTYDVVLDVDNPELILLPGMTAYVNISVAEKNDALRIPSAALRYKPTQESTQKSDQPRGRKSDSPVRKVYVLRDEQAVPVTIVPGINDNRFTEVISGGIKEGDAVIVGDAQPEHGNSNGGNNNAGGSGVRMRLF